MLRLLYIQNSALNTLVVTMLNEQTNFLCILMLETSKAPVAPSDKRECELIEHGKRVLSDAS